MTRRRDIVAAMRQLELGAAGLALRFPAHFSLHEAACLKGDREEIERRRGELHDTLDALLDNTEGVASLKRELASLDNEVGGA